MRSRPPATARDARRAANAPATEATDTQVAVNAFRRIVRALRLSEQEIRGSTGLSAAQIFVLRQLADGEPAPVGVLAARTMTDRSSVSSVVDKLLQERLVDADRDENDRRRVLVRITRKGQKLLRDAPEAPTILLVAALEELPPAERRALSRSLASLAGRMGLSEESATMLFEDGARAKD